MFSATTTARGEALDQLGRELPDLFRKLGQDVLLLVHEVGEDPFDEALSGRGRGQQHSATIAGVRGPCDVALALERRHDAARGALVEAELGRQLVERGETAAQEDVERVALGDRHVVAADPIAVAELVDADEFSERVLELPRLSRQRRVGRLHSWYQQLYEV